MKLNNGDTEGGGALIEFRELKNVQTVLSCNFLTFGKTKIHDCV